MEKKELTEEQKAYLKYLYYDLNSNVSYGGINALLDQIRLDKKHKINKKQLFKWLSSQNTYTSFKQVNRKFKRPKIFSLSKDYLWELDCGYMTKYRKSNNNYAFFLLVIDALTRFVWTAPLKTLKSDEMVSVLKLLTKEQKPVKARSDRGSEFISKKTKDFWKSIGVHQYFSNNEVKSALAERAIKTIKSKLLKYMHKNKTKKWVKALEQVTSNYNNSIHRIIAMTPEKARKFPEHELYMMQHFTLNDIEFYHFKFNVNDKVKITIAKGKFQREYDERFSNEVFLIADRWKSGNIPVYKIKSLSNELITGTFFEKELQLISLQDETYIIDKILKTRIINNKAQSLVRWLNYDESEDSWVNNEDIENI